MIKEKHPSLKILKPEIIISELHLKDIPDCVSIVEENYSDKNDTHFIEMELLECIIGKFEFPKAFVAIEKVGDRKTIIGFIVISWSWLSYHWYDLYWVNVQKKYQHKGIATRLINHSIKFLRDSDESEKFKAYGLLLSCKQYLEPFYEKFGFKYIDKLDDELLMSYHFKKD